MSEHLARYEALVQRLTWAVESCVDAIENHLEVGNEDALVDLLHDLRAHGIVPPSGRQPRRETVGGYESSGRPATDLRQPPTGPAPGASGRSTG